MSYLLFFVYLTLFSWLLCKIKFIAASGIDKKIIVGLFIIRILAGMFNGYINLYHYADTDAAFFHLEGLKEYDLLFNNPREYLTNIFAHDHLNSGLLDITDSYWNNLRGNLMIKLLSLFNIFTGGSFFVNTVLFNFLTFFGPVAFFRIFSKLFPSKKTILIVSLFLLPSVLYFSSGIHKDGLIFLALGLCCFTLFHMAREKVTLKRCMVLLIGMIIIFLLRNFVLITLLPAIIAWMIAEKNKKFILRTYIGVYVLFIMAFFLAGYIHPALDLPKYVSTRQIAFVEIAKKGQSSININPLYPHFRSFLNNSPQALNHSLMRPYPSEKFTLLYIPAALEILLYEFLFLVFLFFRKTDIKPDPFIYFAVFFALSMFLMIGYTIPIVGAIVRYRSIYWPFLVIPLICYTDWNRLKYIFILNKK